MDCTLTSRLWRCLPYLSRHLHTGSCTGSTSRSRLARGDPRREAGEPEAMAPQGIEHDGQAPGAHTGLALRDADGWKVSRAENREGTSLTGQKSL